MSRTVPPWHEYFIRLSRLVAKRSKDTSRQVGTVLATPDHSIISTGYNSFPRGQYDEDPALHARPAKYEETQHAERNAITEAARKGVSTYGAIAYMESSPCRQCAGALINAGIIEVVACIEDPTQNQFAEDDPASPKPWKEDRELAVQRLLAAGVKVTLVSVPRQTIEV